MRAMTMIWVVPQGYKISDSMYEIFDPTLKPVNLHTTYRRHMYFWILLYEDQL